MSFWRLKTLLILLSIMCLYMRRQRKFSQFFAINNILVKHNNKRRTFCINTIDVNLASHQLNKLTDNAKSKPCSFNMAILFLVYSLKRIKKIRYIFFFYSQSSIFNRIPDTHPIQSQTLTSNRKCNRTLTCIFHGIVQQINQNLLNTNLVTTKHTWHRRIYMQPKFQSFLLCLNPNHIDNFRKKSSCLIRYIHNIHFS